MAEGHQLFSTCIDKLNNRGKCECESAAEPTQRFLDFFCRIGVSLEDRSAYDSTYKYTLVVNNPSRFEKFYSISRDYEIGKYLSRSIDIDKGDAVSYVKKLAKLITDSIIFVVVGVAVILLYYYFVFIRPEEKPDNSINMWICMIAPACLSVVGIVRFFVNLFKIFNNLNTHKELKEYFTLY